jgi:hypothetical protein
MAFKSGQTNAKPLFFWRFFSKFKTFFKKYYFSHFGNFFPNKKNVASDDFHMAMHKQMYKIYKCSLGFDIIFDSCDCVHTHEIQIVPCINMWSFLDFILQLVCSLFVPNSHKFKSWCLYPHDNNETIQTFLNVNPTKCQIYL